MVIRLIKAWKYVLEIFVILRQLTNCQLSSKPATFINVGLGAEAKGISKRLALRQVAVEGESIDGIAGNRASQHSWQAIVGGVEEVGWILPNFCPWDCWECVIGWVGMFWRCDEQEK